LRGGSKQQPIERRADERGTARLTCLNRKSRQSKVQADVDLLLARPMIGETASDSSQKIHIWTGADVARATITAGLFDWLKQHG
jgi:hypothetical protein